MKKEYWHCFIGPFDEDEMEIITNSCNGADFPPRRAAIVAIEKMLGRETSEKCHCSSGWGVSQEEVDAFSKISIAAFIKRNIPKKKRTK